MQAEKILVGREKEIVKFEYMLNSPQAEFLVIYGRRRVGKTFLIKEYFKDHIVFSFTGAFEVELDLQLDNFFNEYYRWTEGKLKNEPPENWTEAFEYLTQYLLSIRRRKKKMVVFIDELPWLDTPRSRFLSALEYFWNQHGSQMDHLLLVTCGSAASWMHKHLLKAKGGLYNRVTQRIALKPFSLSEVERYFDKRKLRFTRYQIVQLYMVMGGIPFYLKEIRKGMSVDQAIDEICFTEGGLLSDEYNQLYYSLFKNADDHIALVEALAAHPTGLTRTKLVQRSGVPDGGTFTRALTNLVDCGFVNSYLPHRKLKKDTVYRLMDQYSLFYLKFIQANVTGRSNLWQSLQSSSGYVPWSGYAYENVVLQHIDEIHTALNIGGVHTQVSSWRFAGDDTMPGSQIDLLIDRKDGIIHLCEVKFTSKEFTLDKAYSTKLRQRRGIFEYASKTKKAVVTTLVTTYPAIENKYYSEEVHSEVTMDDLFDDF